MRWSVVALSYIRSQSEIHQVKDRRASFSWFLLTVLGFGFLFLSSYLDPDNGETSRTLLSMYGYKYIALRCPSRPEPIAPSPSSIILACTYHWTVSTSLLQEFKTEYQHEMSSTPITYSAVRQGKAVSTGPKTGATDIKKAGATELSSTQLDLLPPRKRRNGA